MALAIVSERSKCRPNLVYVLVCETILRNKERDSERRRDKRAEREAKKCAQVDIDKQDKQQANKSVQCLLVLQKLLTCYCMLCGGSGRVALDDVVRRPAG